MNEIDITEDLLVQYLTTYVGDADWVIHLRSLYKKLRYNNEVFKKYVACAVLLPTQTRITDIGLHPESLLFGIAKFDQFNRQEWIEEFREIILRDQKIRAMRDKLRKIGWVEPIEYAPYTRQAYNWLYSKADESGVVSPITKDKIVQDFKHLVCIYGGAVICNVFTRHEKAVEKVFNWRSGYFFEKVIYDVYSPQEMAKIKLAELHDTNEKLIRRPPSMVVSNF